MDESFSLDLLYVDQNIHDELFRLTQHGLSSQLDTQLHQLSNATQYLRILRRDDQQQISLLMLAALHGYDDIVRLLLNHDNTIDQVELKGRINISDETYIDGATALYCACYREHFTVAKTLIELGHANVNQDTNDYPYYPLLIHATIMNRRDILDFLLENKYADVNETKSDDRDECTALIWAAFRGHTSLIEYLIANGADVNYSIKNKDLTASTALSCAELAGHIDAVRVLFNAGADTNIKHKNGDSLLTTAVKKNYHSIIDFLLEQSINTIEDLELAACSSIHISSSIEQMHEVLLILKTAIEWCERSNIPKTCIEPIVAYDYQQECQTVDQLDSIKGNRDRILVETLLIRERIALSRNDITIIKPLHYYGDMLVEHQQFDKCFNLWIHMFYLYQQMKIPTILHRFVWLFCRMLTANQMIPVERFLEICRLVSKQSQVEEKNFAALNAVFLLIIATKILGQEGISKDDQTSVYSWVKDLCRYRLTTIDGKTLLHLCVSVETSKILTFRPIDTVQHLKFPNASGLRLLLACGSRWLDLDAAEPSDGDTPLHLICRQSKDREIIQLLLKSGCHADCVNKYGRTPLDYIEDIETKSLFSSERISSKLKCLCAHLIVNEQLNIESLGASTSSLNKFVVLHGYHWKEKGTFVDARPLIFSLFD